MLRGVALRLLAIAAPIASPAIAADSVWTHAAAPGFEIYSDVPTRGTQQLLEDLMVLRADIESFWPVPQLRNAPPMTVIFCGNIPEFAGFWENRGNLAMEGWDRAFGVTHNDVDVAFNYLAHGGIPGNAGPPFIGNYGGNILQRAYAQHFVDLVGERTPPWLAHGLYKLLNGMCCSPGQILFPALETDTTLGKRLSTHGSQASFESAVAAGTFYPLEVLLSNWKPPPAKRYGHLSVGQGGPYTPWSYTFGPDHKSFWVTLPFGPFIDESYEFVQYCLFANAATYRSGFIKFAQAAANGPLDEADFVRFFGKDYRAMSLELWAYTEVRKQQVFQVSAQPIAPLSFEPVDARQVAQIIAGWKSHLRSAGPF